MAFTPTAAFPLPSTPNAIYTDLWDDNSPSQSSDTATFDMGVNGRDNGVCVVCGFNDRELQEHCHIIPRAEPRTWKLMQDLGYIPKNAKSVLHEPRNGILMCGLHHPGFNRHRFYIRWNSETNEFIVVNHSRNPTFESIHGNVLPFNTNTERCPFPTAFLWHEYRVRSFHPTCDDRLVTPKRGGLRGGGFFGGRDSGGADAGGHDSGGDHGDSGAGTGEQVGGHDVNATFTPMRLEGDNLAQSSSAALVMEKLENLSWNGTAAENFEKYRFDR